MRCLNCEETTTKTHDVRQHEDEFPYTVRKRRCLSCGYEYRTIEVPLEVFNNAMEGEPVDD